VTAGDHQRDRLAEVAHLPNGERGARRVVTRLAVAAVERGGAGDVAEAVGLHVVAGEDHQHAGHLARRSCIKLADVGVRDPRAQHDGRRGLFEMDVVGVAALAGDEVLVFNAPNGLTHAEFHDRS
jgi:hypothetical protein